MRTAARLIHEGASADSEDWSFAADEVELVKTAVYKSAIKVRRGDVVALIESPLLKSAWKEWSRFRRFGLAHGRGPSNERPRYIRAMEALEQEFEDFIADKRKS